MIFVTMLSSFFQERCRVELDARKPSLDLSFLLVEGVDDEIQRELSGHYLLRWHLRIPHNGAALSINSLEMDVLLFRPRLSSLLAREGTEFAALSWKSLGLHAGTRLRQR